MPRKVAVLFHDLDMAELSQMALESLGYEVQIFGYAPDLQAALVGYQPDALVMDFGMHAGHCWDELAQLAENPDTKHLPVVAIVFLDKDARVVAAQSNVVEVLFAPYNIADLADKVKAALESPPSADCNSNAS